MTHKNKVTLARRMSGKQSQHFQSNEWDKRKIAIKIRVAKREKKELMSALGL